MRWHQVSLPDAPTDSTDCQAGTPGSTANILRKKTSEGDCTGLAYWGGGEIVWAFHHPPQGTRWSVGLAFEAMKIDTDGDQTQYWYGDDPISEVDDTGSLISGIDYEIESSQTALKVFVACRF
ncbi:MAG: hypothetical protein DRP45_07575 [Candidatus Zixiibacteriota bacterium]|nr:MAG: hypothetical protein DRP45_07575 [candidate division Zixibacteria bacterium]